VEAVRRKALRTILRDLSWIRKFVPFLGLPVLT
jgi:hypothetical protein